jgi:pimeloyl-ACP methyl ester carboxylesterase
MKKMTLSLLVLGAFLLLGSTTTLSSTPQNTVKSQDGVSIAYETKGKGDIALVFVHCWCCDMNYWAQQIPHFSKKYKVVTLDLAGHGLSSLNRKNYTIGAYGHDVAAVVKKLKLKKIILIGHSMGGPVTLKAAQLLPKQTIAVIGVDTFTNVEQKFTPQQLKMFMAPMEKDFATGTENFLRMMMFTPKTDKNLIEKIVKDMSAAPPEVGLQSMRALFNTDLAAEFQKVKSPIRAVNSDKYPNNIEGNKKHSPSYNVKFMKGVGHFLHMEDANTFNLLLEETIRELLK